MTSCVICLTAAATTTLCPCLHTALCASCAPLLRTPLCPVCRTPIATAHFPRLTPPARDFAALVAARDARDDECHRATAQVILTASPPAESHAAALLARVLALFGAPNRPPVDEHGLAGVPYVSPFAPNATVNGVPVRFALFRAPAAPSRAAVVALEAHRPDFLLVTTRLHQRTAFPSFLSWDAALRSYARHLPRRMWVFLQTKSDSPWKSNTNLYFKEDVYDGLTSMPDQDRPLTHHVVEPAGWLGRGVKKVAERSVFHACRARCLNDGFS